MSASAAAPAFVIPDISAARAKAARSRGARAHNPLGDRYDRRGAYKHGAGLARPARKQSIETTTCAVDDPLEPGKRLLASVNRRVDILEIERSHGRIEVSQYETGRQVQAVMERASGARLGSAGWDIGGSRDQTVAHELSVIYAIEDARLIDKLMGRIVAAVGVPGARFLQTILSGQRTFGQFAADRGRAGENGARQVATHFRILLEYLDDAFAAEGSIRDQVRAWRDTAETTETDERGRAVPKGHGQVWGTPESRYARHMNDDARHLAGRSARVRDIVGARHRVVVDETA